MRVGISLLVWEELAYSFLVLCFIKNEILLLAVDQHLHQIQQMEWQILQIVGAKTDDVSRLRK